MNRDERRRWVRYVAGCTQLTHGERVVLLMLETFADYKDGSGARPGEQALADLCAVTRRVVSTALTKAMRDLKLIEQTHRANPKAHIVATYRLVSVSSSVHIENGSTSSSVHIENGFNEKESGFNEKPNGVSVRSALHTYPPSAPSTTPSSVGSVGPTYLTGDWTPSHETYAELSNEQTIVNLERALRKFRNHYSRIRKVKRIDWDAQFISWVLNDADRAQERAPTNGVANGPPTSKPRSLLDLAARDRAQKNAAAELTNHRPKGISS